MPGTLLFGIDVETANDNAAGFARQARPLFNELKTPVTWYVTGRTLENYPEIFREADQDPLIDLQAHTYDHLLLKSVWLKVPPGKVIHDRTDFFFQQGASFEAVAEDLTRCQDVFRTVLGRPALGLTGPWCYYRGLGDRPDLLELVHRHGFRLLRTFGRDEYDGQPVPLEWQPFRYDLQGYPDLLECMIHDYQDDFYWKMYVNPQSGETYAAHLRTVAEQVAAGDLVWSMASHDHGCATPQGFEKKAAWYREILTYAQNLGIRLCTAGQFYEERNPAAAS